MYLVLSNFFHPICFIMSDHKLAGWRKIVVLFLLFLQAWLQIPSTIPQVTLHLTAWTVYSRELKMHGGVNLLVPSRASQKIVGVKSHSVCAALLYSASAELEPDYPCISKHALCLTQPFTHPSSHIQQCRGKKIFICVFLIWVQFTFYWNGPTFPWTTGHTRLFGCSIH